MAEVEKIFHIAIKGLQQFENRTWKQVKERKHSHYICLEHYKNNHKNLYDYLIEKEVEITFQVDVAQKERVIGYRIEDVLFIIWFDVEHSIYKQ